MFIAHYYYLYLFLFWLAVSDFKYCLARKKCLKKTIQLQLSTSKVRFYILPSFCFWKSCHSSPSCLTFFFAWTYTYLVLTLDLCWWPLSKSHTPFVLLWPPQLRQEKSCIVFRSSEVSLRISCLRVMTTYCSLKKSVLHAQRNITLYIYSWTLDSIVNW